MNAQPASSEGNGLFLLIVFNIVHILRGPYLLLGYPMCHQRWFKPDNKAGKPLKREIKLQYATIAQRIRSN